MFVPSFRIIKEKKYFENLIFFWITVFHTFNHLFHSVHYSSHKIALIKIQSSNTKIRVVFLNSSSREPFVQVLISGDKDKVLTSEREELMRIN